MTLEQPDTRALTCRVGTRRYALPVEAVREVCTDVEVVPMPGVAAPVEGVANVRGALVTVVSAAALLGLPSDRAGASPWLVILRFRGGRVGLGVDDVEDLGAPNDAVLLEIEPRLEALFGASGSSGHGGGSSRAQEGGL